MVASVEEDNGSAIVTVVNRRGVSSSFAVEDVVATKDF